MKALLTILLASGIWCHGGGPGSGLRCDPYAKVCKACKDCTKCKYCSGKDNSASCSVCREKKAAANHR